MRHYQIVQYGMIRYSPKSGVESEVKNARGVGG